GYPREQQARNTGAIPEQRARNTLPLPGRYAQSALPLAPSSRASACLRAASVWPPNMRVSSVTRSFALSRVISEVVRPALVRSEEHTSELQSLTNLVCRLLLEKK